MGEKLTAEQKYALDLCQEICERADALGVSLAKFPVQEVRDLIAAVRRAALAESSRD